VDVDDKANVKHLGVPVVYKVGFELNIMTKAQDDALQLLEQIIPMFQPEYTVTIKDIPDMDLTTDVPIVLTGIGLNDEYEGDFLSRRTIVYTLTFETRINYYGGVSERGVINSTEINFGDLDDFGF
jgi:hypothetical protein